MTLPLILGPPLSRAYWKKVGSIERANFIGHWAGREAAGATAVDLSPQGNDGVHTAVSLGQPSFDGFTCPGYDGATSFTDVETAGLKADFNGKEGTIIQWMKVDDVADWTDGDLHYPMVVKGDANNEVDFYKNANNSMRVLYKANGTAVFRNYATSRIDWFAMGVTWSDSGNAFGAYAAGDLLVAAMAIETWSAAPGVMDRAIIGAVSAGPANPWKGLITHTLFWSKALTVSQMRHASRK